MYCTKLGTPDVKRQTDRGRGTEMACTMNKSFVLYETVHFSNDTVHLLMIM